MKKVIKEVTKKEVKEKLPLYEIYGTNPPLHILNKLSQNNNKNKDKSIEIAEQ